MRKINTQYIDKLIDRENSEWDRVHTNYKNMELTELVLCLGHIRTIREILEDLKHFPLNKTIVDMYYYGRILGSCAQECMRRFPNKSIDEILTWKELIKEE